MKALKIILLLQCLCYATAFAQPSTQWLHFNVDDGLPTNNVYSTIIDHSGYLWMATDNGAVRYNGYRFDIFNTDKGLPSDDVYMLREDSKGRIWVYTLSYEFGYILGDKYFQLPLKENNHVIYPSDVYESNGWTFFTYYYGTYGKQMLVFFNGKEIRYYPVQFNKPFLNIYFDERYRRLVTYTLRSNVYMWDLCIPNNPSSLLSPKCHFNFSFFHEVVRNAVVWFYDNKLFYFNTKSSEVEFIDIARCERRAINIPSLGQGERYVYTATMIQDTFRIITNRSLYTFDKDLKVQNKESFPPFLSDHGISYKSVVNPFSWYATPTNGVWMNTAEPQVFKKDNHLDILRNSVYLGSCYWWDKDRSTLYFVDSSDNLTKWLLPGLPDLRKVLVTKSRKLMLVSGQGLFYFSKGKVEEYAASLKTTTGFNWAIISGQYGTYEVIPDSLRKYLFSGLYDVYMQSQDTFFSLSDRGIIRYTAPNHDSLNLHALIYRLSRFAEFVFDSLNRQFILFNNRMIRTFELKTGIEHELETSVLRQFGLVHIERIKYGRPGELFVLSNDKIWLIRIFNHEIRTIEQNIQLSNARVAVQNGLLAVAGTFGLAIYDTKHAKVRRVLIANAKSRYYKTVNDIAFSTDKKLILSTDKGVFKIEPDTSLLDSDETVNTYFRLILNGSRSKIISNGSTIKLPKNSIQLRLDAINFLGSGLPSYKYFIEGVSTSWEENSSGEIILDNLKPDRYYTMKIKVHDAVLISNLISFKIFIEPFWWQRRESVYAIGITGGMVIIFFIGLTMVITKKVVSRNNEKRRLRVELELRAIHSQINPHFIFNTLSTALYFISKHQTNNAYDHVSKFSKLLRSYLKSSRERFITLADEIEILKQYIELQRARFTKAFSYEIFVSEDILPNHLLLPSLLLQPLVENAINHGIFNKEETGHLKIQFFKGNTNTELVCIIDDDGIGRIKAKSINKIYKKEKSSFGTAMTRELIDIFQRYEQMNIDLKYIDKKEPQTGTTVILVIRNIKTC